MSESWGEDCQGIFYTSNQPLFKQAKLPSIEDLTTVLSSSENKKSIHEGQPIGSEYKLGRMYRDAIETCMAPALDTDTIVNMLDGKDVDIEYGDSYLTSGLACNMLVYLIKELGDIYHFNIRNVLLQIENSQGVNSGRRTSNDYTHISSNFNSTEERDNYIENLFSNVLDVDVDFSPNMAEHHRWLSIRTQEGASLEIRPDHGISGGWWCGTTYYDIDMVDESTIVKKNNKSHDWIYYILVKKA